MSAEFSGGTDGGIIIELLKDMVGQLCIVINHFYLISNVLDSVFYLAHDRYRFRGKGGIWSEVVLYITRVPRLVGCPFAMLYEIL